MNIFIEGTNFSNKGAELMLYSIIKEIQERYPESQIFLPYTMSEVNVSRLKKYFKISINIVPTFKYSKIIYKLHLIGLCSLIHIPLYKHIKKLPNNIDCVLDAEGFKFGDQCTWGYTKKNIHEWEWFFNDVKKRGIKYIFLPQAFGPFETKEGKKIVNSLSYNASIVIARDKISYNYLLDSGLSNDKLRLHTDFTSLIDGIIKPEFKEFKNSIAIIPNMQMVKTGKLDYVSYLNLYKKIVTHILDAGNKCYFLNHGGFTDIEFCRDLNIQLGLNLPIIENLDALEIKGIISTAYAVITDRFHAVANALNSGVPVLSFGWSHKYKMLYNDYGISDLLINGTTDNNIKEEIKKIINIENNQAIRNHLSDIVPQIKEKTKKMWDEVWSEISF